MFKVREILFRGKRKGNGEWAYGFYVLDEDGQSWIFTGEVSSSFSMAGEWSRTPVGSSTIGQYTGLKDKNGAKIFEGDILGSSTTYPLLVSIKEGHTQVTFKARGRIYTQPIFQEDIVDDEHLGVIGNIYSNPELLEEHKKEETSV